MTEATGSSDDKRVDKAVTEMTLGELKEFVREHGHSIGIEVTRSEVQNMKYTAMPRNQVIAPDQPGPE